MNIDPAQIILWGIVIAVVLVVVAALWKIIRLAITLIAGLAAFTLIADQLSGGSAMQQIAEKISNWIKTRMSQ